jgi:hypothetical protein
MNKRHFIILVVYILATYVAVSQNCTVPDPPVLTTVSVQPGIGKTDFTWTLSPSTGIAAYIVYTYKNGDGTAIDTLWDPSATSYSVPSTDTRYYSVSYVLASYRLPGIPGTVGCPSPLSNVLSTIFANADIDTCNSKIMISWNSYLPVPKKVTGYTVLVSVNGNIFTEAETVGAEKNSYTINDFSINSDYCFIIRANLEGGYSSTSNKTCLSTDMVRPPDWINADYASVNSDNKISLSFTIDPASEINRFILERKKGFSGSFQVVAQPVPVNGSVLYTDARADVDTIYFYRLLAVNSCNIPVTVSNIASNLVLSLEKAGNDIKLTWNSYRTWAGINSGYGVFVNTGNGYAERAPVNFSDTVFILKYKEIMYEISGNKVCFYISATENSNPHGIVSGHSLSSTVCTEPTELITVPNVFTPGSGSVNAFFKPVLSFTPKSYHLIVSNRQGKVLFETSDFNESWDGSGNSKPEPQGIFLWFLKVTTPSGKSVSRTGTVTIINKR